MKFVLASNNAHKLKEFAAILAADDSVEIISQSEAGCSIDVDETGETFAENAYLKAEAVMRATGMAAIADDSGICVDALGGAPGVRSARYTGRHDDTDVQRYEFLLKNMEGITDRSAHFACCICCVLPDGSALYAHGKCEGQILHGPRGEGGFGYDPIFLPDGFSRSMGELTAEEKNSISHRGRALREFQNMWRSHIYADK
ncbi:MAG: RdgB/HAM1 family non-canonical purine NTP pyrophosphatase [Eubacteriales bacterium]|nr:RdgB/HAM1 family non-canonical purine NTP pyrophosphatase [Eubacteriales bacterium]